MKESRRLRFSLRNSASLMRSVWKRNAVSKAATDESDTAGQALGGIDIADARLIFIGVALAHRAEPGSVAIQVGACSSAPVVTWQIANSNPDHPHLHSEHHELKQGRKLISILQSRVREAGGDLVFPALFQPVGKKNSLQKSLKIADALPM
jgi:hypothetical protein